MTVKKEKYNVRVGKLACVGRCMDMLSCAGYVGGKKMSVWTVWSVQATTEGRKCLLGRVSWCEL